MKTDYDALGLAVLTLSTCAGALIVPDLSLASLQSPSEGAAFGMSLIFTAIVVLRGRGRRGSRLERRLLAAFLAFMPLVYIQSSFRFGGSTEWLLVELGGLVLFASLAALGLWRSPWFLVVGLAAHGLLWDSWHPGRASFMPPWYAAACLSIDLGWAIYAATQVQAFREGAIAPKQGPY